jgi:dihydrofolate reductase
MKLSLIVAVSDNGIIGSGGSLPWRLSSDLKRFKNLTMGHHLIVGRKTYESIGKPLPGRHMIVLSRDRSYQPSGVEIAHDLGDAIQLCQEDDEAFVGGGATVYELAMPRADRLYLTRVHAEVEGDVRFPPWHEELWVLRSRAQHPSDERNQYPHSFCVYERVRAQSSIPTEP